MPKMILIVHNKHLRETRIGANLVFSHYIKKKNSYIYDPPAENQPRIEEVPEFFRTYLNGEIKDVPFYETPEDVVLLGANIWYPRYTSEEFEKMVAEMKKISEEYNVDVVLWTKHYFIKKRMNITDFQRENSTIGNVEKYFDIIYAVDPVQKLKGCVVRILKNNFGELSEHYMG
mgnify:CR=1 FL=1